MRVTAFQKFLTIGLVAVGIVLWLGNSSYFVRAPSRGPFLLAHRGAAQTYSREGLGRDSCTATRIYPPQHPFLENTIASMHAAFSYGADVVEFDVHPTTDGHFAVFHDWTLECRTNGHGVTRRASLADLKKLDIGWGYTADGGKTFPFRGKGRGLMPSMDEVLSTFPDRRFLINVKSNDPAEGELLARRLERLPARQRRLLMAYGGPLPINVLRRRIPTMPTLSKPGLKRCLLTYAALGWLGYVPRSCERNVIIVPSNVAPWLWGWPARFVSRMEKAGSPVFLVNAYSGDGMNGIDSTRDLEAEVPAHYGGGIWTDRIDIIGPALRRRTSARTGPDL